MALKKVPKRKPKNRLPDPNSLTAAVNWHKFSQGDAGSIWEETAEKEAKDKKRAAELVASQIDEARKLLEKVSTKHLQGKHNQQMHGYRFNKDLSMAQLRKYRKAGLISDFTDRSRARGGKGQKQPGESVPKFFRAAGERRGETAGETEAKWREAKRQQALARARKRAAGKKPKPVPKPKPKPPEPKPKPKPKPVPKKPKVEPKPEKKPPVTGGGNVPTFKKSKEANEYVVEKGYADKADFGKMKPEVVQEVVESLDYHMSRYPELKDQMGFVGSTQARNRALKQHVKDNYFDAEETRRRYKKWYPERSEAEIEKMVTRSANKTANRYVRNVGQNTWAQARRKQDRGPSAEYGAHGVSFNEKYSKNPKEFKSGLDYSVKSGYHPPGCNTVKSVMDHELGHSLDYMLGITTGRVSHPRFAAIFNKTLRMEGGVKKNVSGYGATNSAEFFAEAWAEFLNNPNPRPTAVEIGQLVEDLYKERYG